jgi:3-hydroxyisobutyrate dehydrogenase-like beta-hydroxyacid dehydrogenase
MTPRVGLIGLGVMGEAMAVNVAKAGHDLTVFDLREEPMGRLRALGAVAAESVADLARTSTVVMIVVVDEAQTEAVLLGTPNEPGVLESAARGSVVLVHSTIGPDACRRFAGLAAERGIDLLDAPITGGPSGARAGSLAVMVGGDADALERCRFALEAVSGEIFPVGDVGAGQLAKLANNVALAITMQAVHEALALGSSVGIDPETLLRVLGSGAADSWVVRQWHGIGESARDYPGGIDGLVSLTYKDLSLALAAAARRQVPLPVTALTSQALGAPYRTAAAHP